MTKSKYLAGLVVLVCTAANADYIFESLDVDRSGSVSQEEAASMPGLADNWQDLDGNADGVLDQEELKGFDAGTKEAAAPAPGPAAAKSE